MAYRRSGSYGRRSSSRRSFRKKSSLHKPGMKRWEATDFMVSATSSNPSGSLAESLLVVHLASVQMSLIDTANPDNAGIVLASMKRSILIGGIVMNYGFEPTGTYDSNAANFTSFHEIGICSDKLVEDASSIFPNCVQGWAPMTSMFPTVPFGTTAAGMQREGVRPTQIHWRHRQCMQWGMRSLDPEPEGVTLVPCYQNIQTRTGTVNRRLRLVIDDDHGLFLYFATLNQLNFAVSTSALTLIRWAGGTLYWRYSNG